MLLDPLIEREELRGAQTEEPLLHSGSNMSMVPEDRALADINIFPAGLQAGLRLPPPSCRLSVDSSMNDLKHGIRTWKALRESLGWSDQLSDRWW